MRAQLDINKAKYSLYDYVLMLMIISCMAFADIDFLCIGFQIIALAFTALRVFKERTLRKNQFAHICWVSVFALYCVISSLWASTSNTTVFSTSFAIVQTGIIAFMIMFYAIIEKKINNCISAVIISATIIVVRFFCTFPVSSWGNEGRIVGEKLFSTNATAMVLAYAAVFLFYRLINRKYVSKREWQVIRIIFMSIFMLVSLLMGTKKVILIFGIGAIILYLSKAKNPISFLAKVIFVCLSAFCLYKLLLLNNVLYNTIGSRIELMISGFLGGATDRSTDDRIAFARQALEVFKKNPIIGIGQDGFRYENYRMLTYSHNNYTEILANLGLIGFSIYYGRIVFYLKKSFEVVRKNILPIAVMTTIIIIDFGSVSYSSEMTWIMIALCHAMIFIEENR